MKSIFEYEALVPSGEVINGFFKGSKSEFEKMVTQKSITIIKVKEKKEKLDKSKFTDNDLLSLIEELYYLTNSGMSIDQSIKMLIKTVKKATTLNILKTVLKELKNGSQLSISIKKAMDKENILLDTLSISFISTSEEVGELSNGLKQLFEYLTFKKKIRSEVRQALSYPIFLIGMSVVVSFLIFFLIIPKFATIFSPEEFEKLPTLSYAVLSLGNYLNKNIFEFFIGFFILFIIIFFIFKKININWLNIFYHIPKLSDIIIDLQLTIIYNALSTMITGGLELDRALKQMQKVSLLPQLSDLLRNTLYELKRGQKLSDIFSISSIIPISDIALLKVGENSASLDKVFKSLATRHSDAFSESVKKLLSILEPAVIVLLGIFIAVIVVAIMMAVMSISDVVG